MDIKLNIKVIIQFIDNTWRHLVESMQSLAQSCWLVLRHHVRFLSITGILSETDSFLRASQCYAL